jgi:hypothetical protein
VTAALHVIDAALVACEAAIRSARLAVAAAVKGEQPAAPAPDPLACPRCRSVDGAAAGGGVRVCAGCGANFRGREVIGG